jgi:alpha-D-ribose 1-methylphosphonate 5-triphosphate diphosphatase
MIEAELTGAPVLRPGGWDDAPLAIAAGRIAGQGGRRIDLSGYEIRPGIVDIHGDGFERHLAPRRGALSDLRLGVVALAAELASCGITTAMLAQFWSWEGGMRGPDFALRMFEAVRQIGPSLPVDLRLQMRLETHDIDAFAAAEDALARFGIGYVVFNDHLPHDRLAEGRRPKRLTGTALKSGRNPEAHLALMQRLHEGRAAVPAALDALTGRLATRAILMGSHDDQTPEDRAQWRARGVAITEFPETEAAARAARDHGEPIVLGAPNVVRGASHAGKVSARALIAAGLCDALASDYHYPAPANAARIAAELGLSDARAWSLVSEGPARILGLSDRGRIEPGLRADLIIVNRENQRIEATIAGGRIAWLTDPLATRFIA